MREYTITVDAPENIKIQNYAGTQIYEPVFLGYYGEDEATELTINFPSDWTVYIDWFYSGAWHEGTTTYTETITYSVPSEVIIVGDVYMRLRTSAGYTEPIKFEVRL